MWTAGTQYHIQNKIIGISIDIKYVCVFLPAFMSALLCGLLYIITKDIYSSNAGLLAALFYAILPAATSRSIAGSFDNECTSIFALIFSFYLWQKAVNSGNLLLTVLSAFGYYYMVASWGAYIFVLNLIGVHVLILIILGKYSNKMYISYSGFISLGVLLSSLVKFIDDDSLSLQPHHIGPIGVFCIIQLIEITRFINRFTKKETSEYIIYLLYYFIIICTCILLLLISFGKIPTLAGRLLSLLGLKSAATIVKSVSEHQPSTWFYLFINFHVQSYFAPISILYCILYPNNNTIFILLYCQLCSYFVSTMVRQIVVMAPIISIHSGISISIIIKTFMNSFTSKKNIILINYYNNEALKKDKYGTLENKFTFKKFINKYIKNKILKIISQLIIILQTGIIFTQIRHSIKITSTYYSNPMFMRIYRNKNGNMLGMEDDTREAYSWQRYNTPYNSKILSWWDYGYQISGMADRTVYVDNNTNDYFQIATVGLVLSSSEKRAYEILQMWDTDYILVVQGSLAKQVSDDINKFIWIIRICSGYYPEVDEEDYLTKEHSFLVGKEAPKRLRESLLYKMSYYNLPINQNGETEDYIRGTTVPINNIDFRYLEEVYSTKNFLIRIYRVKKETDRGFLEELDIERALLSR